MFRIDEKVINIKGDGILCFMVIRDERFRLPWLFDYYGSKGVDRFFVVDNGSKDDTMSFLLAQPDTYVWSVEGNFKTDKMKWTKKILDEYGQGKWCLIIDADEVLYYPGCETKSLHDLARRIECQGKNAMQAILLDMYSDKPLKDVVLSKGQNPLDVCPFFDIQFWHSRDGIWQDYYYGGMRRRVFGEGHGNGTHFWLTKFPFLKYSSKMEVSMGMHLVHNLRVSSTSGALLHFKYVSTFMDKIKNAVLEKQYAVDSVEYGLYKEVLGGEAGSQSFYSKSMSRRLENSGQLERMGAIRSGVPAEKIPFKIGFIVEAMVGVYKIVRDMKRYLFVLLGKAKKRFMRGHE